MLERCWQIHFCVMDAEGLNYFYIPNKVIRANELTKSSSTQICIDLRSSLLQTYCCSHLQPFPLPPFCDTSSTPCFPILMLSYTPSRFFSFSPFPPFVCWLCTSWPPSQARGVLPGFGVTPKVSAAVPTRRRAKDSSLLCLRISIVP